MGTRITFSPFVRSRGNKMKDILRPNLTLEINSGWSSCGRQVTAELKQTKKPPWLSAYYKQFLETGFALIPHIHVQVNILIASANGFFLPSLYAFQSLRAIHENKFRWSRRLTIPHSTPEFLCSKLNSAVNIDTFMLELSVNVRFVAFENYFSFFPRREMIRDRIAQHPQLISPCVCKLQKTIWR